MIYIITEQFIGLNKITTIGLIQSLFLLLIDLWEIIEFKILLKKKSLTNQLFSDTFMKSFLIVKIKFQKTYKYFLLVSENRKTYFCERKKYLSQNNVKFGVRNKFLKKQNYWHRNNHNQIQIEIAGKKIITKALRWFELLWGRSKSFMDIRIQMRLSMDFRVEKVKRLRTSL